MKVKHKLNQHKYHMGKITPHHILSLLLLLGYSSLILMGAVYGHKTSNSDNVSAMSDSNVAALSSTILPSLELSMASSVSLAIEPTSEGQFSRKPLDIDVSTNSTSGYTLTMMANRGGDNKGALKRDRKVLNQDYYILALDEETSCSDETATTCDNFPSGYWGYRIANSSSSSYISNSNDESSSSDGSSNSSTTSPYKSIIPFINNATEIKHTSSSTGSISDRTTIYFGSKIDNTTPTGNYTGIELTFAVTTNIFQWTINYHAGNDSVDKDTVIGLPDALTGTIDSDDETGERIINLANAPTRPGYAFLGWCNVKPTTKSTGLDECNGGTEYAPNQEIIIRINDASVLNFYAMWSSAKVNVTFTLNPGVAKLTIRGYFGTNMEMQEQTITNSQTLQLAAKSIYTLTPSYADGYRATDDDKISKLGDGTLEQNIYTTGMNTATITVNAMARDDMSLKVYFDPTEVKSVSVREGSASGTVKATLTTGDDSTGPILTFGRNYYLVPEFQNYHIFGYWEKTGPTGSLSNTSSEIPYYNIGYDDNAATIYTIKAMQIITASDCTSTPKLAYDTRDNQKYTIGRMKDDSCWMLSNLNLGGSTAMTLKSSDTNISAATWTLPALSTSAPTNDYVNAKLYRPTGTAKMYVSSAWVNTTDAKTIGVLYNYVAASAGTITTNSNQNAQEYDICPKGWHLPSTNSAASDFGKLAIAYDGNTDGTSNFSSSTQAYQDFNNAFYAVLSGYFSSSSLYNVGSYGCLWSSTVLDSTSRYNFRVDGANVYTSNSDSRGRGFSIRCVLK